MTNKLIAIVVASLFSQVCLAADVTYPPLNNKTPNLLGSASPAVSAVNKVEVKPLEANPATLTEPAVNKPVRKKTVVANSVTTKKKLPIKEEVLPGLGMVQGVKDYFKPVVVRANATRTEMVEIARNFPSRISTPFQTPKIIDQTKTDISVSGQGIYVTPKSDSPFTIFVTGSGDNDPVISLTLVPRDIPSQTILMQIDRPDGSPANVSVTDEVMPASDSYTDSLRALLRSVAMGKVPAGFADAPLPSVMANIDGFVVAPVARYSGPNSDIYAYRIEGTSELSVELEENSFYQPGVRAVSFFPRTSLSLGESTLVYVISDKLETR